MALFVEGKEHEAPLPLVACGEAPAYDCTVLDSSLADGKLPCVAPCLWLLSALLIAVLPIALRLSREFVRDVESRNAVGRVD